MAPRKTKQDSVDPRGAVLAAALARAADKGWRDVTLRDLAEASGVGFAEVYAAFATPAHVTAAVIEDALAAAMGEALPEASLSAKDRVFDAAMNLFDALKNKRVALGAMLASYGRRPLSAGPVLRVLGKAARVTLERAGVATEGAAGVARVAALTRTLWLMLGVLAGDDDGLSRTMAGLDTRLREAERWAKRLGWDRGRAEAAA